jgi:glycosyltransferase involved in cell wall biosynthesis
MRIAFLDFTPWDYHAASPYEIPLGGSQSALCYLSAELARRGHGVILANGSTVRRTSCGVTCVPLSSFTAELMGRCDVVVAQNFAKACQRLPPRPAGRPRLVLWTQHAHDQPAVQALARPDVRAAFDGFALVSRWQLEKYRGRFGLAADRCRILRNGIGRPFRGLFSGRDELSACKRRPPVLVYTSTPFRGLDILLAAFSSVRRAVPGTTLEVYSSMGVYQVDPPEDERRYGALYRQCRTLAGVEYVGSLPQPELAERLRAAAVLAYPSHFAETSCIAVMEAMAAGCRVVTSTLGALPETCMGLGRLVAFTPDAGRFARSFCDETVSVLKEMEEPGVQAAADDLWRQVARVNAECDWARLAGGWEAWLRELAGR